MAHRLLRLTVTVATGLLGTGCGSVPRQPVGTLAPGAGGPATTAPAPTSRPAAATTQAEFLALMVERRRIECAYHDGRIVALRFDGDGVIDTDRMIERLPDLDAVEELFFYGADVTEDGVRSAIRKFPRLKVVVLMSLSVIGDHFAVPAAAGDLAVVYAQTAHIGGPADPINAALRARAKPGRTEVRWWSQLEREWRERRDKSY
jgi:hypothetical protein